MFFAEVRHFEEIFRQGEQPSSGSASSSSSRAGNAQQAEQLAELQKQIINGTWKLIRRETGAEADGQVRRGRQGRSTESQQSAIEQAGGARRAAARRGLEGQPGRRPSTP